MSLAALLAAVPLPVSTRDGPPGPAVPDSAPSHSAAYASIRDMAGRGMAARREALIHDTTVRDITVRDMAVRDITVREVAVARRYWTPARMAAVTPLDRRGGLFRPQSAPLLGGRAFHGVPTVGVLFFTSRRRRDHYCTASVVAGRGRNLLLTAAHCLFSYDRGAHHGHYRSHIAFVPKYEHARAPYGIWTARRLYVPYGWSHRGDVDLDFGFVALGHNRAGKNIADLTGANRIAPNVRLPRRIRVIGYSTEANGGGRPVYCDTTARRRSRRQMVFVCDGFYGGTSGSPWLWRYDAAHGRGLVIGVIGGFHAGGRTPRRSYSAVFDEDIMRLWRRIDRGRGT